MRANACGTPASTSPSTPGTPNASHTRRRCATVVVSSQEIPTRSASTSRRFTPRACAAATTSAARPGTVAATVSKNATSATDTPPARNPAASRAAI